MRQSIGLCAFGQFGCQLVKAHDVAEQPPKARTQQVAALCEHAVQVGAIPLQHFARVVPARLHRKRHIRCCSADVQALKQADQPWVGALVVNQKAGVHAVGDSALSRWQSHVHRVGVAAKVTASFEQAEVDMLV